MKHGKARIRVLVIAAGISCLGAARPESEAVPPFHPEVYEQQQVTAQRYRQAYCEGILITGTEGYIAGMKAALELIEATDARNWYFVRKNIRRITLNGHIGIDIGGGRMTSGSNPDEPVESLASRIVHEAWHRELFLRGEEWEGRAAETFCIERQNEFLGKLRFGAVDLEAALRSEYWKVDYWSRDW